jgi:4a-hydroxytetrahydrobiopterin dehydratase
MASEKLTQEGIDAKLAELPEWSSSGGALQRTFKFENFIEAMAFVNRVAEQAEEVQHHPDILVRYSKVTLTLSTHDAGGITQKDFDFAREVDRLLSAAR